MAKRILCDTNVWLDYYCGTRPLHDAANRLVKSSLRQGVMLMVPMSCLGDFFYLCRKDLKQGFREFSGSVSESNAAAANEGAWACLDALLNIATVVGGDGSDARIALKHKNLHGDYEDDLVIAAAFRSEADCLVTCDKRLLAKSPILALTPDEAIAYLGLDLQ